jgi:hypothetical protein
MNANEENECVGCVSADRARQGMKPPPSFYLRSFAFICGQSFFPLEWE